MEDTKLYLTGEVIDLKVEQKVVTFLPLSIHLVAEKEGMSMILSTEEVGILEIYQIVEEMSGKAKVVEIVILIDLGAIHSMTEVVILNVLIHGKAVLLNENKINLKLLLKWAILSGHLLIRLLTIGVVLISLHKSVGEQ